MPTYEYRCQHGHTFDVVQRMADDPVAVCEVCDAPAQRVFRPPAVHFKGSGFYNTDYGTRKRAREQKESGEGASKSSESAGSSKSESNGSSNSDSSSSSDSATSTATKSSSD
ncbi:MAG: FmdB family zinc ribbon protein [Solirubrobacteraceae bacterium]